MKSYETRIPSRRLSSRRYVWLAALALSACGGSEDVDVQGRNAQLAEGCVLNTDCTAPLVCAFRKCHAQCTATRDCDPGLLCVASDKPFHVCQLQSETRCAYNSQCSGSQVCGVDGKCREQCATEKDCLPGQKCAQGTCAEPPELSGGKLPVASGASGAGGGPAGGACLYADDCAANEVCRGGQCMAECRSDRDCVSPKSCVDGRCRLPAPSDGSTPPKGYGEGCNLNSDCPAPLTCGSAGLCVYACVADVDCASACCQGHACVATAICGGSGGAGGAGGSGGGGAGGSAGSAGGTSGTAGATSGGASGSGGSGGTVGGPCDVDKDGFKAAGGACGGNDCDDADAKTHPGAKELCDGVDNNCDGLVDENAWLTQGIKELAIAGSYPGADPYGSSPPGLVVLPTVPPRVFVSAGDQGPMGPRVVVQELDGNLDPQGAVIAVHASQYVYKTNLASDGASLMVAASVWDSGGGTLRAASFAPGAAPTTLPLIATETTHASRPSVAWTGTKYALAWTDGHSGPERLYRTAAAPMQAFPPPVPVYADPTKQTTSYGDYPTAALGVGGSTVAVLSRTSSVGALLTFDVSFSTVGIPSNADLGIDMWPSAVAPVAGNWLALGLGTSQTTAMRIDAKTGSVSATRALSATAGFGDVLPLGNGGALMAWASSTDIRYAFVTADLGTGGQTDPSQYAPLPVNDLQAGPAAISAPVLARIDATHIAIVWQDGKLKAAILECSP